MNLNFFKDHNESKPLYTSGIIEYMEQNRTKFKTGGLRRLEGVLW